MEYTIPKTLVLFLFAMFLSNCAGMKPTGYLNDYKRLKNSDQLEKVWHNPNEKIDSTSVIVLKRINTTFINDSKGVTIADVNEWLKHGLKKCAQKEGLNLVINDSVKKGDYILELAVTRMTPGSSYGREDLGETVAPIW